jgi:hypothetical protein
VFYRKRTNATIHEITTSFAVRFRQNYLKVDVEAAVALKLYPQSLSSARNSGVKYFHQQSFFTLG